MQFFFKKISFFSLLLLFAFVCFHNEEMDEGTDMDGGQAYVFG